MLDGIMKFLQSPQSAALGASLLQQSGYSERPPTFGEAMGKGLLDMQAADFEDLKRKKMLEEISQMQMQTQAQKKFQDYFAGQASSDNKVSPVLGEPNNNSSNAPATGNLNDPKMRASMLAGLGDFKGALNVFDKSQPSTSDIFDVESKLRGEFIGQSKDFKTINDAMGKVEAAYSQSLNDPTSGASDVALIFGYMKLLDPKSVVRESEYATAENTGSIPNAVWTQFNKAKSGERLSPEMRANFFKAAQEQYGAQNRSQEAIEAQYTGLANRNKVNPENVIINYRTPKTPIPLTKTLQQMSDQELEDLLKE